MKSLLNRAGEFIRAEEGLAVTEYGLLLALVAVALVAVLRTFGTSISGWFSRTTDAVTAP
jgi:Flp pilus assembly pilin Flp